ncbi:MAG: amino acid ABC transporter substrate-binding protein, partial [Actinomycetota bacterium]|nr:amino acid ABC transporter substrate-binding protein [Actinomycetota bacterium]
TNERGGLLGRRIELAAEDDQSQAATAIRIYEKLITQDKVDAVFSPYSSPLTDAVADVLEKYKVPMVACCAATSAIYRKGRKFIFMVPTPSEKYLEGVVDIAARRGLKTIVLIYEDSLHPKAITEGAIEFAKKKGLQVALVRAYPRGTADFRPLLQSVRELKPDVLAAPGYFDDAVTIIPQMKELNVNPKMFAVTSGGDLLKFYEVLGKSAEFVYGPAEWEPEMVMLRAGGLVPIARQYPGAREFVDTHQKEFPGADLSYQTVEGYAACQIFVAAVKRAASLDASKVRDAILKMDINTVFGPFRVDRDGIQVAHRVATFQWQDGKKVIVWPDELAPGKPRFPTPPWSQRP